MTKTSETLSPQVGATVRSSGSIARRLVDAPPLAEDDVHLWRLPLDPPAWPLDVLHSYLTTDERVRAQQYVFHRDRDQFVAVRGYVRVILAQYVGCGPRDVVFEFGDHGKPYLNPTAIDDELTFNVSHTPGLGLCAVARGRQVGVDIEQMRPEVDIIGIARSTFSPAEQKCLAALPPELHVAAFYACWTRKEAYIKARGDGLSYPLDAFDVTLAPGEPAMLLRSVEGHAEKHRWVFTDIDAGVGYAAALVVERPVTRLCLLGWQ